MTRKHFILGALALLPLATAAQNVAWNVVASEDRRVPMGPLQGNNDRNIDRLYLGEANGSRYTFWHASPDVDRGLWSYNGSSYTQYMKFNVPGVVGGPGRVDTEQNHVFTDLYAGFEDGSPDGRRAFLARAGVPTDAGSLSNGVWTWGGGAGPNREVARAMTDGALGPGLGSDWYIDGSSGFHQVRAINGGAVLVDATVVGPNTERQEVIFKYVPGTGNVACARSGAAVTNLSPGLAAGDQFSRWSSNSRVRTVDAQGRAYGLFDVSNSRTGIFELCNGAPRALAVDDETGSRGPGLASPNAFFTSFYNGAIVGGAGLFHFVAIARETPGGSSINGIYRNDGTRNRPLALSGDTGAYSTHFGNPVAVFNTFNEDTLDAAGRYVVFSASANAGGQGISGVWRAGSSGGPRPIAIAGVLNPGPGGGQTWSNFYERAVFANGDIVMRARTSADETAIWLFRENEAPRRILTPGQAITLPTTAGNVQTTISSFELRSSGGSAAQAASGRDAWASTDGTVLVRAYSSTYGEIWLSAKVTAASDFIFKDEFGG